MKIWHYLVILSLISCNSYYQKVKIENSPEKIITAFQLPLLIDIDTFRLRNLSAECAKKLMYIKSHIRNDGDSVVILVQSLMRNDSITVVDTLDMYLDSYANPCLLSKITKEDIIYLLGKPQREDDNTFSYQVMSSCCVPAPIGRVGDFCYMIEAVWSGNKLIELYALFPAETFPPIPKNCDLWKKKKKLD